MRAAVAGVFDALVRRLETALPQALAAAPQAWDRVDHLLTFFDPALTAHIAAVRRRLEAAAAAGAGEVAAPAATGGAARAANGAVAIEGLLALEAACGLARLIEQRLSSLIRLRVRSGDDDLLPGGRPFLDLAAALKEAARVWT